MFELGLNIKYGFFDKVKIFVIFGVIQSSFGFNMNTGICSTLYKDTDFAGQDFYLENGASLSNVKESHNMMNANDNWGSTNSFKVEPNCKMAICNETHFNGQCKEFKSDLNSIPASFNNVESANCTCDLGCKCDDVYMRGTECARVYLKTGCNTCNSYYTDLKGSQGYFEDTFKPDIRSLLIRRGCSLQIFEDENMEGEIKIYNSTVEDFKDKFDSSVCKCSSVGTSRTLKERKPNAPKLINIPSNVDEIIELIEHDSGMGRHPGLLAALQSMKNKRSPKNAYILFIGTSGSGKSAAINLLFDNTNITKEGDNSSTTINIHEFKVPIKVDDLGINNSNLILIDTPGLGDTNGHAPEAKFLSTLEDYLDTHEELKNRIPNAVIIMAKFHDNRIYGPGASFVKMLRGFDAFRSRITDPKFSNVIFLLSHFMSEKKSLRKQPAYKIASFKKAIEDFSLFPRPITIVLGENKGVDQGLPMLNGFWRLENGDFYPRNLFESIQKATAGGGDPIGEAVIREAFKDSDGFQITEKLFPIVSAKHKRVPHFMSILTKTNYIINDTEISKMLEKAYLKLDPGLKREYPDSLNYIQWCFNVRNIHYRKEIPKVTQDIVKFMKDIRLNDANLFLMDEALGMKLPRMKESSITGYGYNVFEDKPLGKSPYNMEQFSKSDIGYALPTIITCKIQNNVKSIFELVTDFETYKNSRLYGLSVENDVPENQFTGIIRPGYNIFTNGTLETNLNAIREYRRFELILNDKPEFSKEFLNDVNKLERFNATDEFNVKNWQKFFNEYGTHVVKSSYGGGSIQVTLNGANSRDTSALKSMISFIEFAEDISIGRITENRNLTKISIKTQIRDYLLNFKGGDPNLDISTYENLPISESTRHLESWLTTLSFSPTILQSDLKLIPYSQIVKKISQNISEEIYLATLALFNVSLTYKPEVKNIVPVGRGDTKSIQTGEYSQFGKILELFMKSSNETNARFEKMMQEQIRQNNERDTQYRLDRERDKKEQQELYARLEEQRRQDRISMQQLEERRAQAQQEFRSRMEEMENKRQEEQRNHQLQLKKYEDERDEKDRKRLEEITRITSSKSSTESKCLKPGTNITLSDGAQIPVEQLKPGQMILSGNLSPAKVISVSAWYLEDQKFYGFSEDLKFFTETHMFIGDTPLVVSLDRLIYFNPLMKYLNPVQIPKIGQFNMTILENGVIEKRKVQLYTDEQIYPSDMKVYFLQTDQPDGTYWSNGYLTRHELPPMQFWPKTVPIFFSIALHPELSFISKLEYSVTNLRNFDKCIEGGFNSFEDFIKKISVVGGNTTSTSKSETEMIYDENDTSNLELIRMVYENDSVSSFACKLYARYGLMLADYLENKETSVGELQKEIISFSVNYISSNCNLKE